MTKNEMYTRFYKEKFQALAWESAKYVKDLDVAFDIVEDVLERSLDFDFVNIQHLSSWMRTSVINKSLNYYDSEVSRNKAKKDIEYVTQMDSYKDVESVMTEKIRSLMLRDLIEKVCPPRCKMVLILRYYEGLDTKEVAAIMGISTSAVKSQKARGLEFLRKIFKTTKQQADERNMHLINKIKKSEKTAINLGNLYGFSAAAIEHILYNQSFRLNT
jgi:RNA polymerase sigma-70 factor (ECF subfamily)